MRLLALPVLACVAFVGIACAGEGDAADGPIARTTMELATGIHRHVFGLEAGTLVEFEFRSDEEVDLRLLDPAGSELYGWDQVIHVDKLEFEAELDGTYKLEINNTATESPPTSVTIIMQVFPP